MKVAYFSTYFGLTKSGPGRFSEHLRSFSSDKIKFFFFSDNTGSQESNETKVTTLQFFKLFPGYWLIRSYLFYKALKKSFIQFDIILCSNAFEAFFLALIIKNIPVIVMINDDNYIFTRYHFNKVKKLYSLRKTLSRYLGFYIEKFVSQKATTVIVCSNFLKNAVSSSYGIPLNKIEVLYPAVDLTIFKPFSQKRAYFEKDTIRVLFAKNDWRRGGLDIIIEGLSKFKEVRKIQLNIAGVLPNDNKEIISIASNFDFQNNISFVGIQNREGLLKKFHEADILILCSRQEAFGILLLEAMAVGMPIIASNVGGIPEVLDNGRIGFLIPSESPQSLTTLLNELIDQPELLLPKIEHGIEHVKKFSTNILYSNLETLLLNFEREKE